MTEVAYPGADFDQISWGLLSPQNYQNPTPQSRYHLVVVGAGPAGLISAIGAAGLGAKVALIERHRMGGDCLNVGCMPSRRCSPTANALTLIFNKPLAGFERCVPVSHHTIPSNAIPKQV